MTLCAVARILGLLILFCIPGALGLRAADDDRRRLRETEAFLNLIEQIRSQIACCAAPLDEIYGTYHDETLQNCDFLTLLRARGFAEALREKQDEMRLDRETLRILTDFSAQLGTSCAERQIECCTSAIERLREICSALRGSLPGRIRLHTTLGLTAGCMLLILFL